MSEIGEGLGSAVEGGLLARAVEPERGEGQAGELGECANCGTALIGAHCHACGQKAHIHRSISGILHDLMHGVLHLDGKIWHTLPLLAFKPGILTRRYIDGERAKFVSPMAMFLFGVFLMFAVFQMVGISTPSDIPQADDAAEQIADGVDAGAQFALGAAQRQAESLPEGSAERAEAEAEIAELRQVIEDREIASEGGSSLEASNSLTFEGTGVDWIDNNLVAKWRENPGLMLYKLQTNAYKFSWLLIPLSIPFVWLLFVWKRRFKAYDHAIFVTYSLSFMTLLFITGSLVGLSGMSAGWVFALIALIVPIHIYKHLKRTYDLSRFSTIWRLVFLMSFIVIIVGLFLQLLIMLGAF